MTNPAKLFIASRRHQLAFWLCIRAALKIKSGLIKRSLFAYLHPEDKPLTVIAGAKTAFALQKMLAELNPDNESFTSPRVRTYCLEGTIDPRLATNFADPNLRERPSTHVALGSG